MLKRLELSDPNSCLNKSEANEPVFVLRAKDPLAAMTIMHWATMALEVHERERIAEAVALADTMDSWRKKNYPPAPDVAPAPVRDFEELEKIPATADRRVE